jgi:hypothetical protein
MRSTVELLVQAFGKKAKTGRDDFHNAKGLSFHTFD